MVLETTEAWIALLAAYLMFGRFRQRRQAGDLLLVYALALFGFTNLFLSALPGALVGAPRQG
ncbi:MAG: hypothetical protein M3N52_03635, partial [Actinomycetota bacterium]|nr:hypothetical protein [Actinomycetota bacterium]